MTPDLLRRKQTAFVLWRPGHVGVPPSLVIGQYRGGPPPPVLEGERILVMTPLPDMPDLYQISAADCALEEGCVYHYWFEVGDTNVYGPAETPIRITDPTASSVDWRVTHPLPAPYDRDPGRPTANGMPAAVVRFENNQLWPSDAHPDGLATFAHDADVSMAALPTNNRLVIYELPTAWTKCGDVVDGANVGVGTFRDVRALIEKEQGGANFASLPEVSAEQHLVDLGVNALELLPPADSFLDRRSWGYGTSNYFAPDFDLGRPLDADASTAVGDLLALIRACHRRGIRFFYDAVMAFAKQEAYRFANFAEFYVHWGAGDPEQGARDGFGGDLWRYGVAQTSYDPVSGTRGLHYLARRHMIAHLLHWIGFFHVDGLRLDSVNNYNSWDFAGEVTEAARAAWRERWADEEGRGPGAEARFLVVAEELSVPKGLLGKVDALWNEEWKWIARQVLLGRSYSGEPSFEWSVRKLIDCRLLGFARGDQAVNYLGSHDVGGGGNERLYNYLGHHGVVWKERQLKLGFACLLTAVGIPMILAGDEFAQSHQSSQVNDANKEIDPIRFELKAEPWRRDLFLFVSRLVKLRTKADALAVDDTAFLHVDFDGGKRVLVWRRGRPGVDAPVVVVANFSSWGTAEPTSPGARYHVPGWPALPPGHRWREVTTDRDVPTGWAGEEPLYPWEAKVYACVAG